MIIMGLLGPKLNIHEKRKLFILSFLAKDTGQPGQQRLKMLFESAKKAKYADTDILKELENLDAIHDVMLNIEVYQTFPRKYFTVSLQGDEWLTSRGKVYLDQLEHPKNKHGAVVDPEDGHRPLAGFVNGTVSEDGQVVFSD
ncbi:hypothetical protein KBX59_11450 [Lentilactobacillus hilgardii]|nr:hypothetical protein [Lentilactobacillus hilgardii]MCP9350580.1 hypothetical protein [Lentilactobacillus hilgardii]MCP9353456.1 hypothetical protein [Lentilactobacillus hilgardii]